MSHFIAYSHRFIATITSLDYVTMKVDSEDEVRLQGFSDEIDMSFKGDFLTVVEKTRKWVLPTKTAQIFTVLNKSPKLLIQS